MKRSRAVFAISLVVVLLASLLAVPTAFAAEIPASHFAGGWEITSNFVSEGVCATVPGQDTVGAADAWRYRAKIPGDQALSPAFSIADGQKVIIELSVKFYNADGSLVSKSQNSDALDIYVMDAVTNQQIGMLRIWTGSGSPTNADHSCEVFGADWSDKGAGHWIIGNATAESSFTIQVDQENFISSYVSGQDGMAPLANAELLADRREALKDVSAIRFEIGGDNGFTASTQVVVRSINGQSLANTNGKMVDTVAPAFLEAGVAATLNAGTPYTIPTEAFDLLGSVTYSLKIGNSEIAGKTFTPSETGNMDVTLVATDSAGNAAQKTYTFRVVSTIAKPQITTVPTLADQTVACFETLVLDGIEYTDETGTGKVELKMLKGDELVATLSPREDGKFAYFITNDFESGAYTFVYSVNNSAGTATSEAQTITITVKETAQVEFVQGLDSSMLAQYAPSGLVLRTVGDWKEFILGTFDVSDGMDIKYIVNPTVTGGADNDAACVSFFFINADDDNYRVMYRVWVDHSGSDRATNIYISTNAGASYTDIADTGWISRNVGGVAGQYHMAFDPEETFVGERTGGMTRVDNAYEQLVAFFETCPSTRFHVGVQMGNLSGADGNYEMIVTELNGQSFVGETITWQDARLSVKTDIPEKVLNGSALSVRAYAKDLRGPVAIKLIVTAPDGTVTELDFLEGIAEYTFEQLGDHIVKVETTGINGNEVSQIFQVASKTSVDPIDITIDGTYQESYCQKETVVILPATYSANVVKSTVTVTTPAGEKVTVAKGDQYQFAMPGVYVITYTAWDDAQPTPNENSVSVTINVPDAEKPRVNVTLPESAQVGEELRPVIEVTDDSECDLTVVLTKPDGTTQKLDTVSGYVFIPEEAGEYFLKITAEDLYGNKTTVTMSVAVTDGAGTVLLIVGIIAAVLAIGAVVFVVLKKKSEK